jgi:hypothetical protein
MMNFHQNVIKRNIQKCHLLCLLPTLQDSRELLGVIPLLLQELRHYWSNSLEIELKCSTELPDAGKIEQNWEIDYTTISLAFGLRETRRGTCRCSTEFERTFLGWLSAGKDCRPNFVSI